MVQHKQLIIAAITVLLFLVYGFAFPSAENLDEFLAAQDGVAIQSYIFEIFKGNFQNPVDFLYEYQRTTMGLLLNVYPPLVPALYAVSYSILGISLFSARIIHLLFMISFLCLFYVIVNRQQTQKAAVISVSLLMVNFTFMKYFSVLWREIIYVFFIFLSLYLLDRYLRDKNRKVLWLFFLSLIMGSMTKDFFNFCLPALALLFISHYDFKLKKILKGTKEFLKWDAILGILLYLGITLVYYSAKLMTSAKEAEFLFGGFQPLQGFVTYFGFLLKDNFGLVLFFLAAIAYLVLSKKWNRTNDTYMVLFLTFFVILISVHKKNLRYIYIFYPVAAIFIAQMLTSIEKTSKNTARALLIVIIAAIILSSAINIERQQIDMRVTMAPVDDEEAVKLLKEKDITGNILLLTGSYRFDTGFYLRKYNHNLENHMIHSYFERLNAEALFWSRFGKFYEEKPACKEDFTVECWQEFIKFANIKIIIAEKRPTVDKEVSSFINELRKEAPDFETEDSWIYREV